MHAKVEAHLCYSMHYGSEIRRMIHESSIRFYYCINISEYSRDLKFLNHKEEDK